MRGVDSMLSPYERLILAALHSIINMLAVIVRDMKAKRKPRAEIATAVIAEELWLGSRNGFVTGNLPDKIEEAERERTD